MSHQSLTAPTLIAVNVQLLPSATATAECHLFSSVVTRNNTPTDLYLTLLSQQHAYHTQMPLPHSVTTAALKEAFRQPGEGSGAACHFQLHEDKAAAAAAGHPTADAMLYVKRERRDKRPLLTVPLPLTDSRHTSDRLLATLQKLFQRLQDALTAHEASSATRAGDIQRKLAALQHKAATKQAMEQDMAQCTALLLKEKRDELARCEKEYEAALRARREARREKVRREREERRQSPSAEVLGGEDDETDSDGQTTSEDEEEAESELSRLNEQMDEAASDEDAVMQDDGRDWPGQQEEKDLDTASPRSPTAVTDQAAHSSDDGPSQRNMSATTHAAQ